jgi:hypothetical protein
MKINHVLFSDKAIKSLQEKRQEKVSGEKSNGGKDSVIISCSQNGVRDTGKENAGITSFPGVVIVEYNASRSSSTTPFEKKQVNESQKKPYNSPVQEDTFRKVVDEVIIVDYRSLKLQRVIERVRENFYDSPKMKNAVADKLITTLDLHTFIEE